MRPLLVFVTTLVFAASSSYPQEAAHWRADYEKHLKSPIGWLAVSNLIWLKEGENKFIVGTPPQRVVFTLAGKKVIYRQTEIPADSDTRVEVARVAMGVIERDGKYGLRVWDPDAETRRNFTGSTWFPAAETWRITAKWVRYSEPKKLTITNVLGMTDEEPVPGYAEFTVAGQSLKLEPVLDDDQLFFMFKDQTTGKTTYPAGRFLYAPIPKDGEDEVVLDFNQAHNPPCAFTAFATCPLPPRQNILPVAIEAGELNYGHH